MSIFLDLIQSLFIRGSMVAVALTLTVTMNNALYQKSQLNFAKGEVETVGDMMNTDLTQAGYNAPTPAFTIAGASDIQFQGDLDNNGAPETVRYYSVWDASTNYYKLYRTVDGGTPLLVGKRFNSITLQYYDAKGKITAVDSTIAAVRVNLVESIEGATEGFTQVVKNFKIYPSNL